MTFVEVIAIAETLPGVVLETRYDGSPVLKLDGCFVAGIATHESAEANTLVVRYPLDARDDLLADAPDAYYLTEYYERYPLVLARLESLDRAQVTDLLSVSRALTVEKTRRGKKRGPARRARDLA